MVRRGKGKGMGKGYKNLAGRDPKIHSDSARGRKQPQKISHFRYGDKPLKPKMRRPQELHNFDIDKHNWGFENEKGDMKLRLGNWSDAGWHWDGSEKDINGYFIRLSRSDVSDEFLDEMKKNNIKFKDLKKYMEKSLKEGDGFYEISGDNKIWHFGENMIDESEELRSFLEEGQDDIEMTDKISEKFVDNFDYPDTSDYSTFEEKHLDDYKKEMKDFIEESNTFEDFFEKINDEDYKYGWNEELFNHQNELFYDGLLEQWGKFKKEELGAKEVYSVVQSNGKRLALGEFKNFKSAEKFAKKHRGSEVKSVEILPEHLRKKHDLKFKDVTTQQEKL